MIPSKDPLERPDGGPSRSTVGVQAPFGPLLCTSLSFSDPPLDPLQNNYTTPVRTPSTNQYNYTITTTKKKQKKLRTRVSFYFVVFCSYCSYTEYLNGKTRFPLSGFFKRNNYSATAFWHGSCKGRDPLPGPTTSILTRAESCGIIGVTMRTPAPKKDQKELPKHMAAFEVFYSLGERRSVTRCAQVLKVPFEQVKQWAFAFDWNARAKERDLALLEFFKDRESVQVQLLRKQFIETIEVALRKVITLHPDQATVKNTKIRILNASDLEKVVKVHALLTDRPTENVNQSGKVLHKFQVEFV